MQIERNARLALAGLSFVFIAVSAPRALALCGDGMYEPSSESCDDGNTITGDGCNANCQIEAGYTCTSADAAMTTKRDLCCFSDVASAYALQGNASLNNDTGEVTLVPNENQQVGVAWFRQRLDFSTSFKISLRLYLGTNDDNPSSNAVDVGADGGSVLFHRDPKGLMAKGAPGKALGATLGTDVITPVLGVEFDTYNNGDERNDLTTGDEDHVGVFHTSTAKANHLSGPPVCLNETGACKNFEDGKYHVFEVEWTGAETKQLKVYVDGKLRITVTNDVVANYFGGNPQDIYFGFAASTGNSKNLHKFCPLAPRGFEVPRDLDGDGVDDRVDLDDDGDGRPDAAETGDIFAGVDPSSDPDRDGTPVYADPDYWAGVGRPQDCPDVMPPIGACDRLPDAVDFDHDGVPDHLDPDSDGDTVSDVIEDGNKDVAKQDVMPAVMMPDGKLDDCNPSPMTGLCAGTRPPPPDTDMDGAIDSRDVDSDNDATLDGPDVARLDPCMPDAMAPACTGAGADADRDTVMNEIDPAPLDPCVPSVNVPACGVVDPAGDRDGDTIANGVECMTLQSCPDSDGDGSLDFNDPDSDGDGITDGGDPGRLDPCNPDPKHVRCTTGDFDQDGLSNGVECPDPRACPDSNADGKPDYQDPDQDRDEVYDGTDPAPRDACVPNPRALVCVNGDGDGDGFLNTDDPDPRDPCVPDRNVLLCLGGDRDGDGLSNGFECPAVNNCIDTDMDGNPDWSDGDSDGDGAPDVEECEGSAICMADTDGDGLIDLRDPDRPQIAGGACSVDAAMGGRANASLGWLLTVLLATLVGRRWQRRARS